jgi:hypothetical protein
MDFTVVGGRWPDSSNTTPASGRHCEGEHMEEDEVSTQHAGYNMQHAQPPLAALHALT